MDIEQVNTHPTFAKLPVAKLSLMMKEIIKGRPTTRDEIVKLKHSLGKKYKCCPSNSELIHIHNHHLPVKVQNLEIVALLTVKPVRALSGVSPVTVVLAPDDFSCGHDCYYCPDERIANGAKKDMPRSYASTEPAVMRAIEVDFDAVRQVNSRLQVLKNNGHRIDKLEYILEGGTFSNYKKSYVEEFIRDLFYAANVWGAEKRSRLSLEEEQIINETAQVKIIGIVVETRPDYIRWQELRRYRRLGVTRVQIGVQHTDQDVLDYINRGHTYEDSCKAVKMLKTADFKVDIHVMPDLPSTTPEKDSKMLVRVLDDLAPDYMKVYPCLDVTFTKIREWKKDGRWQPYAEKDDGEELKKVLIEMKRHIPPYTRINRLQRDFPNETDKNGNIGFRSDHIKSNLRQILLDRMARNGEKCRCIRCWEIKDRTINYDKCEIQVMPIDTQGTQEYFICVEDTFHKALVGLVRLRIPSPSDQPKIPEIKQAALIRELHVYGQVKTVGSQSSDGSGQHHGIGKQLMQKAEEIALYHGIEKIAVISGVGVRGYYRKLGYKLYGTYMVKHLW